jgi:hypothetical protein
MTSTSYHLNILVVHLVLIDMHCQSHEDPTHLPSGHRDADRAVRRGDRAGAARQAGVLAWVTLASLVSVSGEGGLRLPSLLLPDSPLDPQADFAQLTTLGLCERLED